VLEESNTGRSPFVVVDLCVRETRVFVYDRVHVDYALMSLLTSFRTPSSVFPAGGSDYVRARVCGESSAVRSTDRARWSSSAVAESCQSR
jgi:hypothetical protein